MDADEHQTNPFFKLIHDLQAAERRAEEEFVRLESAKRETHARLEQAEREMLQAKKRSRERAAKIAIHDGLRLELQLKRLRVEDALDEWLDKETALLMANEQEKPANEWEKDEMKVKQSLERLTNWNRCGGGGTARAAL